MKLTILITLFAALVCGCGNPNKPDAEIMTAVKELGAAAARYGYDQGANDALRLYVGQITPTEREQLRSNFLARVKEDFK